MSIKGFFANIFASYIHLKEKKWIQNPIKSQELVFADLIKKASNTTFGKDHDFKSIKSIQDFQNKVSVTDYEGLRPYIDQMIAGQSDVLWPGKPLYLAKTSGTTSGAKYIPLTKESLPYQISAARNALLAYIKETNRADFVTGKMIFLQGSPILNNKNGINLGRLSGIVAHFVPNYLQKNRLPTWETNCIEDWETKVNTIVDETLPENMTLISGIPSWVQMYFEKIVEKTAKPVGEVFKNFNLFVYGGVNYEPYRQKFENLIGRKVDSIELFPASEGFFAYQNSQKDNGLLLLLNSGIFYEFIKADEFYTENPTRYTIKDVELGTNYVLIISTNAGLWGYNIGDTIEFTSLYPFKIRVTGRIKHYISAFGEHVIAKEVETALQQAALQNNALVNEFTVAPQITPVNGLPYHEWLIEFEKNPDNLEKFASDLDILMRKQNVYYDDLIAGNVLQPLVITQIPKKGFQDYMKSKGKLGGQNKLPRLSNDRTIADFFKK